MPEALGAGGGTPMLVAGVSAPQGRQATLAHDLERGPPAELEAPESLDARGDPVHQRAQLGLHRAPRAAQQREGRTLVPILAAHREGETRPAAASTSTPSTV